MFGELGPKILSAFNLAQRFSKGQILVIDPTQPGGFNGSYPIGSMAGQNASAVAVTGGTITGIGTPSSSSDVAIKSYVDSAVSTATGTNAITYAKMQQASANTILGNPTGSLHNVEEITLGNALAFSGTSVNVSPSGDIAWNTNKITGLKDPTTAQDAATKNYVDAVLSGEPNKASCNLATTGALATNIYNNGSSGVGATLTGVSTGVLTIDGVSVTAGMSLLIQNEVTAANNGIYTCTVAGALGVAYVLTRRTDFNSTSNIASGDVTYITAGSTLIGTTWVMTTAGTITPGSTSIAFTQTAGPGSFLATSPILLTGSTFSLLANGITYSYMQQVTAGRLMGNPTGSLANASEITPGYGLGFSGTNLISNNPYSNGAFGGL